MCIKKQSKKAAKRDNPAINNPTNTTFRIPDAKLHVPMVALSTEDGNELLEQLKTGFIWIIKRNKYKWEMSIQAKNNNLNYLIHQHLLRRIVIIVIVIVITS